MIARPPVWSYYDPLGNLDKVPVALVNSDSGEVGSTVTEKLVDADVMNFHVVSASEARSGIADGTYYLGVEIPAGFTDTVTGLKDQVTTVMAPTTGDSVSEQILDKIFVGFSDGAEKAHGGLGTAIEGAMKLQGVLAALQGATVQMGDGAGRLAGGVDKLTGPVTGALDQLPEAHADRRPAEEHAGGAGCGAAGRVRDTGGGDGDAARWNATARGGVATACRQGGAAG